MPYLKYTLYVILLIIGHLCVLKNLKSLKNYIKASKFENQFSIHLFRNLRLKIYLFWIFFVLWFLLRPSGLKTLIHTFKAATGFCFCLILGDLIYILCLSILKNFNTSHNLIALKRAVSIVALFLGIIVAANNFGYSLGGLLTTLGIGSAAVAFAAQNTLSNLWATFSLLLEHPFGEGDHISIGNRVSGTVKRIGIRSTVLVDESGNNIFVPNNIIVNEYLIHTPHR